MYTGPKIKNDNLVFALDSYSNIRGFTKFGTSGTNNSHRAIRNLVDTSSTYSLENSSQLTGGNYFTLYGITYPEGDYSPASRDGVTPGFDNISASKTYEASRDVNYYVFDEDTSTWVADSYFNGLRISGHCYDTYSSTVRAAEHTKFQDDYDTIKTSFPNATHIVIGSHASENVDDDADTVTRLKEIGLPNDAVGLGRVEFVLAGKVNKPHTHHYVRENVSTAVAHMNIRLPLEGVGGAILFDGTNDFVDLNDTLNSIGGLATFEMVFKATETNDTYRVMLGWGNGNSNYSGIHIGSWTSGYTDESFHISLNSSTVQMHVRKGHTFYKDNKYHHAIVTAGQNNYSIWIDGVEQTFTFAIGSQSTSFNNIVGYNSNIVSHVGKRPYGGGSGYFKGEIPVMKVYDTILTETEIKSNFNAYKNRFDIQ